MAQALYKIKEVVLYVRQQGKQSSFRYWLDVCAGLVFEVVPHGILQPEWNLKPKYMEITGTEQWLDPVTKSLEKAYEEYSKDRTCVLEYAMYKKFVSACRIWGTLVSSKSLWELTEDDEEVFNERMDRHTGRESKGSAQTLGTAQIIALLADLKRLAESTDEKVQVLFDDRELQVRMARDEYQNWQRKLDESRPKETQDEKALREAAEHGVYLRP
jgi:hypothetical protein